MGIFKSHNLFPECVNLLCTIASDALCVGEIIYNLAVFHDFYKMTPWKFTNVTNGVVHRRWLNTANPKLSKYLDELIGRGDARAVIDRRIEDPSEGICRRVRVIPIRTVGGESVGYGIRADRVRVELGRETRSVEAFILAANEPISADGARALVPSELL